MTYIINYSDVVIKEHLPLLDSKIKGRIRKAIELKLTTRPEIFGKPLKNSLRGYRKLRVGDYRVVFVIDGKYVKIFAVKHRSKIYKNINFTIYER